MNIQGRDETWFPWVLFCKMVLIFLSKVSAKIYSVARSSFWLREAGKHRTLRLELELSRAFVNSVGKNARNRDGGTRDGHISISRVHETRTGTLFSF